MLFHRVACLQGSMPCQEDGYLLSHTCGSWPPDGSVLRTTATFAPVVLFTVDACTNKMLQSTRVASMCMCDAFGPGLLSKVVYYLLSQTVLSTVQSGHRCFGACRSSYAVALVQHFSCLCWGCSLTSILADITSPSDEVSCCALDCIAWQGRAKLGACAFYWRNFASRTCQ